MLEGAGEIHAIPKLLLLKTPCIVAGQTAVAAVAVVVAVAAVARVAGRNS